MANARNLLIATALSLGWTSAPVQALSLKAPEPSFAKSEAILGGESRLAAILAQQGAPRAAALQPASYNFRRRTIQRASISRAPSVFSAIRPDVFGTIALKVNETSLDGRWRRVERSEIGGQAAKYARSLQKLDEQSRIDSINRYVNRQVTFKDDSRQHGRADVWSTATETLRRGKGDCEDYAIAKLQMLRKAGVSDSNLYLVILKDLVRRTDHAVAVVRSGNEMLVLDNGTDVVLDSDKIGDYRPILTFAVNGAWTHGYRLSHAPVEIASNAAVTIAAPAPASEGLYQRSRSASLRAFITGFSK